MASKGWGPCRLKIRLNAAVALLGILAGSPLSLPCLALWRAQNTAPYMLHETNHQITYSLNDPIDSSVYGM
jgi:hypothetical protein